MSVTYLTKQDRDDIEAGFALKREALVLIDLIAAEFASDPMSVQCFDLRTVQRVKDCAAQVKSLRARSTRSFGLI